MWAYCFSRDAISPNRFTNSSTTYRPTIASYFFASLSAALLAAFMYPLSVPR
jgi:hypothetical protein